MLSDPSFQRASSRSIRDKRALFVSRSSYSLSNGRGGPRSARLDSSGYSMALAGDSSPLQARPAALERALPIQAAQRDGRQGLSPGIQQEVVSRRIYLRRRGGGGQVTVGSSRRGSCGAGCLCAGQGRGRATDVHFPASSVSCLSTINVPQDPPQINKERIYSISKRLGTPNGG